MNEEQLIEFVNWLPTAVPEFQNASPDQIVQSLNQMAESEEGQQMLSQLFTAFQESKQAGNSQMFKKGGKMAAFVNKYGDGGCVSCKKKEILRGGMVNKMAEKMQDGGKNRLDKKLNEVLRTEGDKISYRNVPEGVFSQESWKWKNLRRDALGTGRNPVGSFSRVIINSGTPKADTTYTFMPLTDPKDYIGTNANFITVSRRNAEDVAKYSDFLNNFDAIVDKYSTPETMQKGGELATMTSAETANNIGLIPKAQLGNDTTDWHTKSILEVLPQMQFARRRTYGPGFVDEMSAYADSLDNATLGRLIMPNPTSGQQDTTYFRFFNNPMAEPVYMSLTGNTKRQVDDKFDNTLKKSKNK